VREKKHFPRETKDILFRVDVALPSTHSFTLLFLEPWHERHTEGDDEKERIIASIPRRRRRRRRALLSDVLSFACARLLLLRLCEWVTVTLSQRAHASGFVREMQRFVCETSVEAREICAGESQKSSNALDMWKRATFPAQKFQKKKFKLVSSLKK